MHTEKKVMWRHSKKAAVCKPGRESSPETNPAGTLILDFQPPGLWKNKFLWFKPPSLWYVIMAAQADWYGGHSLETKDENLKDYTGLVRVLADYTSKGHCNSSVITAYCLE